VNNISIEAERGCGYRIVGKIYIVGSGLAAVCDNLPYPIEKCSGCGFTPQFTRGFSWLKKSYIKEHQKFALSRDADGDLEMVECDCPATKCPICHPSENNLEEYGLMWVGDKYYTPEEFIAESNSMGVSKAINKMPKDLILGETWILLAHNKHPFVNEEFMSGESDFKPAIFYAFIPSAYEMLIWEKDATPEKLAELRGEGITPIVVPDDAYEHGG
jgi:hypothetical protein